ncbi:MAG: YdcF family protein [Pseudomonadota bacterium]
MFFVASKLLWVFADPFSVIMLPGLVGLVLCLTRFARLGRRLCVVTVLLLAIACFSPLGGIFLRPLEDRFPLPGKDLPAPSGIIVLGGALDEDLTAARHEPILMPLGDRVVAGAVLARRFPAARLIFTGGSSSLRPTGADEATGVRELWTGLGVDPARMTFETRSRNTWENALFTRALIKPKPGESFLLVTSAWHMPRAMGIFRRLGYKVVAYPTDYMTFGNSADFALIHLGFGELTMLEYALHEWIGLTAYHLTGKTDAWFPAP